MVDRIAKVFVRASLVYGIVSVVRGSDRGRGGKSYLDRFRDGGGGGARGEREER